MVLATHLIFSAYGFWLPNDPRGSWSEFVAAWELLLAGGKATKVQTRQSVAGIDHDHAARFEAKKSLNYPPVEFTGDQAVAIAQGFARAVGESGYVVYACSILPAHVHAVVGRHATDAGRIAGHLKTRATQELGRRGLHPLAAFVSEEGRAPSPWGRNGWEVYLNTPEAVWRAAEYVAENPVKEGKRRQEWSFVMRFGG